jgi:hypothetical protein
VPGFCRHRFGIRLKEHNVRHAVLCHLGPISAWYLVFPWPSNDKSTASVDVRSSSLPSPPLGPVFSYVSCPRVHMSPHIQSENFSVTFPTKRNASTVICRVVCNTVWYRSLPAVHRHSWRHNHLRDYTASQSNRQYLHPHRQSLVSERNAQLTVQQ